MQYFKSQSGKIYAYEDGVPPSRMADGLTPMNQTEVDALLHPVAVVSTDTLKAAVTAHRWRVETSGLTLPSGVKVSTGTEDQNRITTVVANAQASGVTQVDFKAASGWVTLTIAEVQEVAAAIALHVQACFSAERMHHEAIDAIEDDADLQTYDATTGWPEN